MPGSYSEAAILADSALEKLMLAYKEINSPDVGLLILDAQERIKELKQIISDFTPIDDFSMDPYEISESNSAI